MAQGDASVQMPSIDSIISMLHAQAPEGGSGLDTLRMQMFGRYYDELEGRMKELRAVVDGSVARNRRALVERVDELGSALHRDMVALRQETNKELEDLKRDVFTAVMSLSALNDKLGMADSRFRETWTALAKALTDRIDQQAGSFQAGIRAFQERVDATIADKVVREVTAALTRPQAPMRS